MELKKVLELKSGLYYGKNEDGEKIIIDNRSRLDPRSIIYKVNHFVLYRK